MSATAGPELRWAEGAEDVNECVNVRERVFCVEQGVPRELELDGRDDEALHLLAIAPGAGTVGTLRLLFDGARVKVGRVAVDREWRGRGIASQMLGLALQRARERGCTDARLAAQTSATGVYERAGFTIESGEFEEAGIPHVWMGRPLSERYG
ncbi:MAG TPA: GNAT family N-acetyltransferase [Solirubrobacteraceae bacterium]|jgi:predicted GNAT family N-acyltransferase|nr:GNAT family N-acetyltransferase [Solirubrobacteraceae bacterium]